MREQSNETRGNLPQGANTEEIKGHETPEVLKSEKPDDGEAPVSPDPNDAPKPDKKNRRKIIFIGAGVLLISVIGGVIYWLYARQFESTDDAFIDGDIVQISPKVAAYVKRVYSRSNEYVHKGDLLVELDPSDYQVKLEQAKAQFENAKSQYGLALSNIDLTKKSTGAAQAQARSNVETTTGNVEQTRLAAQSKKSQISQAQAVVRTAQANLAQTRAQTEQAESNLNLAQVEYDRRRALFSRGDISRQSLDQTLNALQSAQSQLNAIHKEIDAAQSRVDEANANVATARENYRQSLAQIDVTRSQVGESQGRLEDANAGPERINVSESQRETAAAGISAAEAAVHEAELELSYTKIYAPEDGYVTRKTVEEGQLAAVGTPLMAISQSDELWIVANFKETQLENMKVGQTVSIKVDAYPHQSFRGRVDSLQAGTGSRFSLLPAENATGNFVKVVQRVPVKIVFDEKPKPNNDILLAPGMSVEPSVKVR